MKFSDCLPNDAPSKSILTTGQPVEACVIYHYTGDLTQSDLPAGSFLSDRAVGTKQLAADLTHAHFPYGPIKRRTLWLSRDALEQWFENHPPRTARLFAGVYKSKVDIPAGYFADVQLPDE